MTVKKYTNVYHDVMINVNNKKFIYDKCDRLGCSCYEYSDKELLAFIGNDFIEQEDTTAEIIYQMIQNWDRENGEDFIDYHENMGNGEKFYTWFDMKNLLTDEAKKAIAYTRDSYDMPLIIQDIFNECNIDEEEFYKLFSEFISEDDDLIEEFFASFEK